MRLPEQAIRNAPQLLRNTGDADLGENLARFFFGLWENPEVGRQLRMTLASGVTDGHAAATLREFITAEILGPVVAADGRPDAALRIQLTMSHLIGAAVVRYVVAVEPMASAGLDTVVHWIAPTLQRYLTAPPG